MGNVLRLIEALGGLDSFVVSDPSKYWTDLTHKTKECSLRFNAADEDEAIEVKLNFQASGHNQTITEEITDANTKKNIAEWLNKATTSMLAISIDNIDDKKPKKSEVDNLEDELAQTEAILKLFEEKKLDERIGNIAGKIMNTALNATLAGVNKVDHSLIEKLILALKFVK